jgi:hypothetical protein
MTSLHMMPEFRFFSWPNIFPAEEDYTAIWPDSLDDAQSSAVQHPCLSSLVSAVSSGIPKVTHVSVSQDIHAANGFGNPSYSGVTFSDADAANTVAFTSPPASDIYLEDRINDFDKVQHVSIQQLMVEYLTYALQDLSTPWLESTPCRSWSSSYHVLLCSPSVKL